MKKTTHYKGHRWTTEELKTLMQLWAADEPLSVIAENLSVSTHAVSKMVHALRKNGVPLMRRKAGHEAGKSNKPWTQGEVEYLIRKRQEKATCEEIAAHLQRTWYAVNGMILRLRSEGVPVAMRGNGVRKLWNADSLKAVHLQLSESNVIEFDAKKTA